MKLFKIDSVLKNIIVTAALLFLAYLISSFILPLTGVENNSALVFVLSVAVISMITTGYVYGLVASLISAFCINYFFMYPYAEFNFELSGYPVAIASNLSIAVIVCTLMSRIKKHAVEAEEREQKTKELYEKNSILEAERAKVKMKAFEAEARSNILMAVSHDLRTPLTAIAGSASVILNQGSTGCSESNLKLVSDIKEDAEWLSAMVENILLVTKLKDFNEPLHMRSEVLDDIAESTIVKCKRRFPDACVEYLYPEDIIMVSVDTMLIQQVFINLIENAIRHSGSTEPIRITTEAADSKVIISVSDHGIGLPEDILTQINDRSPVTVERRADSSRGIGIGISVCQTILEAHKTFLQAENLPDGGCRMYFELPIDLIQNIE